MMGFAVFFGVLAGIGLTQIFSGVLSTPPHLKTFLNRLSAPSSQVQGVDGAGLEERLGRLGVGLEERSVFISQLIPKEADFRILEVAKPEFWAKKIIFSFAGLVLGFVVGAMFWLGLGLTPGVLFLSPLLSVVMFFAYDGEIRSKAKAKRRELDFAVTSFTDLLVIERVGGAGAAKAINAAASVGDSWGFTVLQRALARAKLNNQQPWDALRQVADEFESRTLRRIADVMSTAGVGGAGVITQLRQAAALTRDEQGNLEAEKQGKITGLLFLPQIMMVVGIFVIVLFGLMENISQI